MRYVQFQIVPDHGSLHPLERILRADDLVSQEAIHHMRLLSDDTVVGIYEFTGERDRLAAIFDDHPDVLHFMVSEANDAVYVQARTRTTEQTRQLLDIQRHHDIVVDSPVEYTRDGGFRITSIGSLPTLRATAAELPDGLDVSFENTGEYIPRRNRPFTQLTARQQEVLTTAVEMGYYESPHQCTYRDIADELGISPETVGEHLRKAESTVVKLSIP